MPVRGDLDGVVGDELDLDGRAVHAGGGECRSEAVGVGLGKWAGGSDQHAVGSGGDRGDLPALRGGPACQRPGDGRLGRGGLVDGERGERQRQRDDDERGHDHGGGSASMHWLPGSVGLDGGPAVHPVDRHDDETRGQDGADVGDEQQQGPEGLVGVAPDSRVRPTTESGGTSEIAMATPGSVSEMSSRANATEPTAPVAERGEQIDEVRRDPCGDLRVVGGVDRDADEDAEQPPDRHDRGRPGDNQPDAAQQVVTIRQHDAEDGPEDGHHERSNDHRPDHRGRGVPDDARRCDDCGQQQEQPVPAQPPSRRPDPRRTAELASVGRRCQSRMARCAPSRFGPATTAPELLRW